MRYFVPIAMAVICAAQVSAPLIGYVRTSANELRPVHGVAGAFLLGDPVQRDVLSAGFTSRTGLVKNATEVLFYRGGALVSRHPAPEGRALFRFTPDGEPAAIRFHDCDCREWNEGSLTPAPETLCATVADREQVGAEWFAVHKDGHILLQRGNETWRLPGQ